MTDLHVGAIDERSGDGSGGDGYAPPEERPRLRSYAAMTSAFGAGAAAFLIAARRGEVELPETVTKDLLLVGASTHKLARLITKDKVTSFLRVPFRRLEGEAGPAEVSEETRGTGPRAAIGELIGCPYCLGLWVASGLMVGLSLAPGEIRLITSTLSALTISDFLQSHTAGARSSSESPRRSRVKLYHVTDREWARRIADGGFEDTEVIYDNRDLCRGVWLADRCLADENDVGSPLSVPIEDVDPRQRRRPGEPLQA
jgi:hypothetical protein